MWVGASVELTSWVTFIFLFISIVSWMVVESSERLPMVSMTSKVLITLCMLTFLSGSVFMFYLMFELTMIPTVVLVFKYGAQVEKFKATYYMVGYVMTMSLPFIFYIMTTEELTTLHYEKFLMICFMGLMLVKFPMYGLHLWLPNAHVEASTTGSMLLAGLLLKLGVYGLMILGGLMKSVSMYLLMMCGILGMVVGGYMASTSPDTKMLAAYSSVTHMNVVVFALLVYTPYMSGVSLITSMGHGFISMLMFYVVGEMYYYNGSRNLYYNLSVGYISLFLVAMVSLNWLSNVGMPPSLTFFSELLFISSAINHHTTISGLVLIYFMISFYYSIYIMMGMMKSKKGSSLGLAMVSSSLLLNILSFNLLTLLL